MKQHFEFEGRATRTDYWKTQVGIFLFALVGGLVAAILAGVFGKGGAAVIAALLLLVIAIPMMWVNLAVTVKRAHDLGHTGWMTLAMMIPIIGFGFMVYFGCFKGQEENNVYGPSPYTEQV